MFRLERAYDEDILSTGDTGQDGAVDATKRMDCQPYVIFNENETSSDLNAYSKTCGTR